MRRFFSVVLLASFLGCGAPPEQIADTPPPPPQPVAGPGMATAPDGVPIAYTVTGSGSPTLVFVHGWMCNQTFWSGQVDAFATSNTVVTIDLPGHGLSGMEREDWPMLGLGADVKAVVEELDLDTVILIGHSMGGPIVLEAARLMPDRVIGVIGVDCLQDADFKYEPGQAEAFLEAFTSDFAGACNQFVVAMFREGTNAGIIDQVRTDMCSGDPEIGIALMGQYSGYDLGAALAAVSVPVRCINANMWGTNIDANRRYNENYDAVIIEGPGHFLMMEVPEEFNAHLVEVVAEIIQQS